MRILLAAVLIAASAHAEGETPAPAAPAIAPAAQSAHLAAAVRLYQKLDLDAALAELAQAEVAAKDSEDETVQALIYRGLIFSETGKLNDATDQFKRALAIRPWAEVPADTSPRIAKTFSDARRSLWGMATVKPPQKKAAPLNASPASTTQTPPAQPAVAPGK